MHTYGKTLPTLNKVIIKCAVHYIVHLQCTSTVCQVHTFVCIYLARLGCRMLRPVLAWRAVWNLWTVYLFNFPFLFGQRQTADNWISGYGGPLQQIRKHQFTRSCNLVSPLSASPSSSGWVVIGNIWIRSPGLESQLGCRLSKLTLTVPLWKCPYTNFK
jgi:hypothetical protein